MKHDPDLSLFLKNNPQILKTKASPGRRWFLFWILAAALVGLCFAL